MDTRVSTSTAFKAGYVQKDLEEIVGIQTEEPLIRAYMPIGGIRVAQKAAQAFGIKTDSAVDNVFIN
jgi:formate C-acetyltransferase